MRLVDADAVDARRRVATGELLLAVQADEAGRARAVSPAVVRNDAATSVVAHHRVARVVLLLAKLALVTCPKRTVYTSSNQNKVYVLMIQTHNKDGPLARGKRIHQREWRSIRLRTMRLGTQKKVGRRNPGDFLSRFSPRASPARPAVDLHHIRRGARLIRAQ